MGQKKLDLNLRFLILLSFASCVSPKVDNAKSSVKQMNTYMEDLNTPAGPLNSPTQCEIQIPDSEVDVSESKVVPDELLLTIEQLDQGLLKQDAHASLDLKELFYDFALLGGDVNSLAQALCFHNQNRQKTFNAQFHENGPEDKGDLNKSEDLREGKMHLADQCQIFINDMNKQKTEARFFSIDLCKGKILAMPSADPYGGVAQNEAGMPQEGNGQMPHGFHLLGGIHEGEKAWSPGRRLHGIEKNINKNSSSRLIAFHRGVAKSRSNGQLFRYVKSGIRSNEENEMKLNQIAPEKYAEGKSAGCSVVSPENFVLVDSLTSTNREPTAQTPGKGSLFYIYGAAEQSKGLSYCGPKSEDLFL